MATELLRLWHIACIAFLLLQASTANAQAGGATPPDGDVPVDEIEEVEEIRRYSVEVIVFKYSSSVSAGNELFEPEPVLESMAGDSAAMRETRPGEPPTNEEVVEYGDFVDPVVEETELTEIPSLAGIDFRRLLPEEMTMTAIHKKLVDLDAYRPVLWGGWAQAVIGQEITPSIKLRALGILPLNMHGNLTLYLKNYLHLVVDMSMQQQIATVEPIYRREHRAYGDARAGGDFGYNIADTQTILYRINEDRLFNSGHLRYFDHPRFGLLVRVNRVEDSADEELDVEPDPDGPALLSMNDPD